MNNFNERIAALSPEQRKLLEARMKSTGLNLDLLGKGLQSTLEPASEREYYPVASAQKRLFILEQLEGISSSYNSPEAQMIEGKLDQRRIETVFETLVKRHDAFRTTFEFLNGEPVQRIHKEAVLQIENYESPDREAEIKDIIRQFIRPFDLSKAPLLRVGLIKLSDDKHILMYDMHHIIGDGTSMVILIKEFISLYNGAELAPLRLQYKDFSEWQNNLFATGAIKKQEEYWLNHLSGEIPILNMVTDYPRPSLQNFEGRQFGLTIDQKVTRELDQLVSETGATLFMVLLAAFNVLLYKYTGQEDIIIGSPITGRTHADLSNIIGMFVNTLAMRNQPRGHQTFKEFLAQVIQNSLQAYQNQECQFEEIINKLNLKRDLSRNPLFDVMFVLQNQFDNMERGVEINGLQFRPYDFHKGTAKFDIWLSAMKDIHNGEIALAVEYCVKLYQEATMMRMMRHFVWILAQVINNPDIILRDIEILTADEKRFILEDFNHTSAEYPRTQTIHGLFETQAEKTPENIAIFFEDKSLTYSQLNKQANQLAGYLTVDCEIRTGSLVGILMERSFELMVAILGILKAGGAYVPIDPDYPEERIKTIINDAGLTTVISSKKYLKTLNRMQWECNQFKFFNCLDSANIYQEEETHKNELMDEKLWNYIGDDATDEITGGGWVNSYTGQDFSKAEMMEYADNIYSKLKPYLNHQTRILEIGCASGISMFRIAPEVGFYYGVDLSSSIIDKNNHRITREGIENIRVQCLQAHEIDKIDQCEFDIVIMNSVVHCFHGHQYLRNVIKKAIALLKPHGLLFIGDLLDQDLKTEFVDSLMEFKQKNRHHNYRTKTDFSAELFVSKQFFEDLGADMADIKEVKASPKIYHLENELTRYRYDITIMVNKNGRRNTVSQEKHKYQHDLRNIAKYDGSLTPKPITPQNLAYVIYTSGSTGKPKGVMIEHHSVINRLNWMQKQYPIGADDTILQKTPVTFDVSVWELFWWGFYGAKVCFLTPGGEKDPQIIGEAIARYKITTIHFVPSMLTMFLEHLEKRDQITGITSLRRVFASGEALNPPLVKKFNQMLWKTHQIQLHNLYGPTEATVDVSFFNCSGELDPQTIPIGRPIDNIRLYIFNGNNQLQPIGVSGELCIAGVGVGRGYLFNPTLTAERFVPDPFYRGERMYRTGDLAKWLPDGNIEFLGRIDHQVKIRGFRIELGEIESQLAKSEFVTEAVVIARDDANDGKYLCAYLVSDHQFTVNELREFLAKELPEYMIPSYFIQMEKLPLSSNGKIDRKALPLPADSINTGEAYVAPDNEIEAGMVSIWENILKVKNIGVHDNFFELGGHSLKATTLMSEIFKKYQVEIPMREVFKHPTIHELSNIIILGETTDYLSIQIAPPREYYKTSSAQKRLYILDRLEGVSTCYNMPGIMVLEDELDFKRIEVIINELIRRHEAFRTSFELINGEPVQIIHPTVDFQIHYVELEESNIQEYLSGFIQPFDLKKAPLLRASLIKTSPRKFFLVYDMHHIISDGTSMAILVKEFRDLYYGMELPELRIQYKDFSEWQNQRLASENFKKQEEYWIRQFSGKIPVLNLLTDYPRPPVRSYEGDRESFVIKQPLLQKVRDFLINTETTLFMFLLAAYNILLAKYSGQDDIVVGIGIAGRLHADLHNTIGMFVNSLAMRNFPKSEKTVQRFLKEVKENSLEAFENQEYQFEKLVEKLNIYRDPSRNPLFDAAFVLLNMQVINVKTEELRKTSDFTAETFKIAKFDLSLYGLETSDGITLSLEYCTKLFKRETIMEMADSYLTIVASMVSNPDMAIYSINIMDKTKQDTIVSNVKANQDLLDDVEFEL